MREDQHRERRPGPAPPGRRASACVVTPSTQSRSASPGFRSPERRPPRRARADTAPAYRPIPRRDTTRVPDHARRMRGKRGGADRATDRMAGKLHGSLEQEKREDPVGTWPVRASGNPASSLRPGRAARSTTSAGRDGIVDWTLGHDGPTALGCLPSVSPSFRPSVQTPRRAECRPSASRARSSRLRPGSAHPVASCAGGRSRRSDEHAMLQSPRTR